MVIKYFMLKLFQNVEIFVLIETSVVVIMMSAASGSVS